MLNARPVQGFFRRLRRGANVVLIAILLAIPWIRIDGEPLVLLDIPARKFHVFGLVIYPQELYFLRLLIAALGLALFFFTALAGRLWCGWACPQTVFTDLFAGIARSIQGWSRSGPPARVALWRRGATWLVWLAVSFVVGFHVVGYFHSPYRFAGELARGELPATAGAFVLVVSALCYLDFAIVRQTFCKYLCPYARFQSVLFDRDTLVIGYDSLRGDPRGKAGKVSGDCVDCGLCVAVCPSEIDIREGMQLECIACTQCIDACDGVMQKLGRPRGLIDYRSLVGLERLRPVRLVRPRVVVYAALLATTIFVFAELVASREPLDLQVAHNASELYGTAADGRLSNSFTLRIQNRDRRDHRFLVSLDAPQAFELVTGVNPISVAATENAEARVFVLADPEHLADVSGSRSLEFVLRQLDGAQHDVVRRCTFVAPSGPGGGAGR